MAISTTMFLLFVGILIYPHVECIDRGEVIQRAIFWQKQGVPYSMSAYRADAQGKSYRTDCSGYVSLAWKLSSSLTTVSLPQVSHKISKNDLAAGDILLKGGPGSSGANGHVVIFDKWVDGTKARYMGYEQTPPKTVYRSIPYPYFNDNRYEPYRYNHITAGGTGGGGECKCTTGRALGEYCGSQLTGGGCTKDHIYGCNKPGGEVSMKYGNCKLGCIAEGDGKSHCKK